jgi:hypothetical protein
VPRGQESLPKHWPLWRRDASNCSGAPRNQAAAWSAVWFARPPSKLQQHASNEVDRTCKAQGLLRNFEVRSGRMIWRASSVASTAAASDDGRPQIPAGKVAGTCNAGSQRACRAVTTTPLRPPARNKQGPGRRREAASSLVAATDDLPHFARSYPHAHVSLFIRHDFSRG